MARRPGSSSRGAVGTQAEHPASAKPDDLVVLGELGRPHGLRGEIRLKSYTSDPLAIAGYRPLVTANGRRIVIADAKPAPGASPDILVVTIEGVTDRTGAEALTRQVLHCSRAVLGEPEEEDEVFTADLIGLDAIDTTGAVIGSIVAVPNYGGGDLLEIRPALGGATALLPFTKGFVPTLDVANRRVVVDPPEDLFAPPGPKPADEPA